MGGGGIMSFIAPLLDIASTAIGQPELIPIIQGVSGAIQDPKNPLLGAAVGAGTSLAGNEAGAFLGGGSDLFGLNPTGAGNTNLLSDLGVPGGTQSIAGALTGAGSGATSAALLGGNPGTAALLGGATGAVAPNIGDLLQGITGGSATTATPGSATSPAGTVSGSPVTSSTGSAATGVSGTAGSPVAPASITAAPGEGSDLFSLSSSTGNDTSTALPATTAPTSVAATGATPLSNLLNTSPSIGDTGTSLASGGSTSPISTSTGGSASSSNVGGSSPTSGSGLSQILSSINPFGSSTSEPTWGANIQNAAVGSTPPDTSSQISISGGPNSTPAGGVPGGTTATAVPAPPVDQSFLSKLKSPSALISGGGLAANLLLGQGNPGKFGNLKNEAGTLTTQGTQLQSYLQSGTLPPGVQAGINQATDALKATIRSQYARMGMSGSSSEAEALANADQQAAIQGTAIAQQLLTQGTSEANMGSQIYQQLMQTQLQQDQSLASGVSNFANALAGQPAGGGSFKIVAG